MVAIGPELLDERGERGPRVAVPADGTRHIPPRDAPTMIPPLLQTPRHAATLRTTTDTPAATGDCGQASHGLVALLLLGIAPNNEAVAAVRAESERVVDLMKPWSTGAGYLNFAEGPADASRAYGEAA